ncbi:MAG: isoprenylcysteine carboxylmethyltransferase family protein [Acidobacteria bacterium]|nr:isoprenylcysteine carboxylmethyltransferase family protein [Acidobacteriota bacterium]
MQPTQTETSLTFRKLAQRIRVPVGFLLAPLLILAAQPTPRSLLIGAALSLIGLLLRAWASGYLKKNQELTTTGPYAHTRNPLYFGTFIMAAGIAISTDAWWFVALFMALYLLIYVPVMQAEAATLAKLFPHEFALYSQRVPMFVPRLAPYRDEKKLPAQTSERRFALSQYLKHREYQAALGLLLGYAILVAKFFLLQ